MKKIIFYILNIPLYYLSYLIKKDQKLWIFGAWSGYSYSDNSKYFFEYINNEHPEINTIWITKHKSVYNKLSKLGYQVEYAYSTRGYWFSMRAKVAIISNTKLGDLNGFVLNKQTMFVQLWHGNPIKKIGYDTISAKKYLRNERLRYIFPWLNIEYDIFCVTSDYVKKFFYSAFKISKNKMYVTGYPRNLNLIHTSKEEQNVNEIKKLIYMPTYRDNKVLEKQLFKNIDFKKIDNFLKKYNMELDIKLHPQSILYQEMSKLYLSKINLLKINDIYEILNQYDLLITDYSSIYFDFLLLEKPIVLMPIDISEYSKLRGIYQDYFNEFQENIALDTNELIACLFKTLIIKDNIYKKERIYLKNKYNSIQISNNFSKNIYDIIIKNNKGK